MLNGVFFLFEKLKSKDGLVRCGRRRLCVK